MNRIPFEKVQTTLAAVLRKLGFRARSRRHLRAPLCRDHRDGVYTHGINRFPRFVATIRNGSVESDAEPRRVAALWRAGALGRPPRPRQSERAGRDGPRHRAQPRARHRLRRAGQHQPLDARRHLRLAGCRGRLRRHLLDQHHAQSAALGRRRARHRQQSTGRSPCRAPAGPWCSTWPCRSSPTARSRATASAANCCPSMAASTPRAISPAIPAPSRNPGGRCRSATGRARGSPWCST